MKQARKLIVLATTTLCWFGTASFAQVVMDEPVTSPAGNDDPTAQPGVAGDEQSGELVANPRFEGWAEFKPGSNAVYEMDITAQGQTVKAELTMTLTAIDADSASVTGSSVATVNGQQVPLPEQHETIKARVPRGQQWQPEGGGNVRFSEDGTETLEFDGKTYECRIIVLTDDSPSGGGTVRMWWNDDVPGGILRMHVESTDQSQTITMKLKGFKAA